MASKWNQDKAQLEKEKKLAARLEQSRHELITAQRQANWARASELQYGVIPELEKELKQREKREKSGEQNLSMLHDAVTGIDIAEVVSRATGIPVSVRPPVTRLTASLLGSFQVGFYLRLRALGSHPNLERRV